MILWDPHADHDLDYLIRSMYSNSHLPPTTVCTALPMLLTAVLFASRHC